MDYSNHQTLQDIQRIFVDAFDGKPDVQFWEHVAYRSTVSCGELALSGWITAFCLWSPEGKWLPWESLPAIPKQPPVPPPVVRPPWKEPVEAGGPSKGNALTWAGKRLARALPALLRKSGERRKVAHEPSSQKESEQTAVASSTSGQEKPQRSLVEHGRHGGLEVDGIQYCTIPTDSLPAGYSEVDVTVDDNGEAIYCKMVAGHVAIAVSSSKPEGQLDTLSPSTHWFMFEKTSKYL